MANLPEDAPRVVRILCSIPVFGRILREVLYGPMENTYYALPIVAVIWIGAVWIWGVWALIVPFNLLTLVILYVLLVRWLDRA